MWLISLNSKNVYILTISLQQVGFTALWLPPVSKAASWKSNGGWMIRAIQELRALHDGKVFKPYGVGECWDNDRTIEDWLSEANAWSDNLVGAFDFPLRDRLQSFCDSYGCSKR